MRRLMEFSMRVQYLRAVYHRAMGETILFRLTFTDAPEFTVAEDLQAGVVTISSPHFEGVLTLRTGRDYADDIATIREWIEQHVDISRLTLRKRTTTAGTYWRTHPKRR